jgi:hypothetical protein
MNINQLAWSDPNTLHVRCLSRSPRFYAKICSEKEKEVIRP